MAIQVGTNGANTLTGTSAVDLLFGKGGNDTLSGGAKLDLLVGGKGNDVLDGGKGYDLLLGGKGNDVVVSVDADLMDGGKGTDVAVLLRETSTASFKIDMSSCIQILADKTIMSNFEQLVFFGGSGNDVVKGGGLNDIISGGTGADQLYGNGGDDILIGNASDKLYGGAGADTISITALPTLVDGGAGVDTLRVVGPMAFTPGIVTGVEKFVVVDGFLNFDKVSGAGELVSFNNFFDPSGGPLTTGPGLNITVAATTIIGEPTQDEAIGVNIAGSSHDDSITGGGGDDVLNGGRGDDTLRGGDGGDRLNGGTGLDYLYGEGGDDFLYSKNPDGQDVLLDGGAGFDFGWIERTKLGSSLNIDVSNSGALAVASDGTKVVGIERFNIEGGAFNDSIVSGAGNDLLDGNAGSDTLVGNGGDDGLWAGAGNDLLFGGDGVDRAFYTGRQTDYSIVRNADNSVTVTDLRATSPEGVDTLWDIEYVTFQHSTTVFGVDFLLT